MLAEVAVRRNIPIGNDELNALFAAAWPDHQWRDFAPVLSRSLTYITAHTASQLIGFVNVANSRRSSLQILTASRNRTSTIADAVIGLTGIVSRLAERREQTDQQVRDMRVELQAQAKTTDARFERVESHLEALIEMFELHLREDHGRRPS